MDSTNPDLSAFRAHGGKLIMLEHMSDYAQSPYAGIGYFQSVEARMGADATREFMRRAKSCDQIFFPMHVAQKSRDRRSSLSTLTLHGFGRHEAAPSKRRLRRIDPKLSPSIPKRR